MERDIKELTDHEFTEDARRLVCGLENYYSGEIVQATVDTRRRYLRVYIKGDFDERELYGLVQRVKDILTSIRIRVSQVSFLRADET